MKWVGRRCASPAHADHRSSPPLEGHDCTARFLFLVPRANEPHCAIVISSGIDNYQRPQLQVKPSTVAGIVREVFEADDLVRPLDIMGRLIKLTDLGTLPSGIQARARGLRALETPLGRKLQAVSALLRVRHTTFASNEKLEEDSMDAYIHFMHLSTGYEEDARFGIVIIIVNRFIWKEAARDDRLGSMVHLAFLNRLLFKN